MRSPNLAAPLAALRRWVIVPASALTIAWLVATHVPPKEAAKLNVLEYDWLAHGSGYMVLAACWLICIQSRSHARLNRLAVVVWLAIAGFGAIDEATQPLAGRDCSGYDWLADATGAAVGVAIVSMLLWRFVLRSGKEEVLD